LIHTTLPFSPKRIVTILTIIITSSRSAVVLSSRTVPLLLVWGQRLGGPNARSLVLAFFSSTPGGSPFLPPPNTRRYSNTARFPFVSLDSSILHSKWRINREEKKFPRKLLPPESPLQILGPDPNVWKRNMVTTTTAAASANQNNSDKDVFDAREPEKSENGDETNQVSSNKEDEDDDQNNNNVVTKNNNNNNNNAKKEDEEVEALIVSTQQLSVQEIEAFPRALRRMAHWISSGHCTNILVVSGAGVSVSAGIPDFRSPGTGLYDNLQKYNLPFPEAVFDLQYYSKRPKAFCQLAHELWPGMGKFQPTLTHSFLVLLAKKGLLLRNYSQNIDGLEYLAGLPSDKLVECHGHFRTASCISCGKAADIAYVKETMVMKQDVPTCQRCKKYVKPDIVFFGEGLPQIFFRNLQQDLKRADLCLVLGTSLQVAPVSLLPEQVTDRCKRLLLNRELVGDFELVNDEDDDENENVRDFFCQGDVDDSIAKLAQLLGWHDELKQLHKATITETGTNDKAEVP